MLHDLVARAVLCAAVAIAAADCEERAGLEVAAPAGTTVTVRDSKTARAVTLRIMVDSTFSKIHQRSREENLRYRADDAELAIPPKKIEADVMPVGR